MVVVHTKLYGHFTNNVRSVLAISFIFFIALCTAHVHAQPITPPAIITSPGTYELTGDLTGIYDGYGIKIESSDVILDGQGFTLRGSNREDVGILVNKYGTALNNVEIKNIKLGDWGTAIHYNYVKGDETDRSTVSNTQIYNSKVGVRVEYSNNIMVQDLSFTDASSAIVIDHDSSDIIIHKATITGCGIGVTLEHSQGITLSESNINRCEVYGVQAGDVLDLTISKTSISDNKYAAIILANINGFTLNSNVLARTGIGAALQLSSGVVNGLIYDNIFQSRENVVKPSAANIVWYIEKQPGTNILGGPYLGGNYWGGAEGQSGFSDITSDTEGYGIADMPYEIDEYNIDKYPLHKTEKTSLPSEIVQSSPGEEKKVDVSVSNSPSEISITSMPFDDETENEIDIRDVAMTNMYVSEPLQTPKPISETRTLASSALLSVEGMSFLIFTGVPNGATVWLIGDIGAEQAGIVSGGVLTVPVNPNGPFYNSYRITAPGYRTFEEKFRIYPSTEGTSVLIPVEMVPDQSATSQEESFEESASTAELLPTSTLVLDDQGSSTPVESSSEPSFSIQTPSEAPAESLSPEPVLLINESSVTPSPTVFETVQPKPVETYEENSVTPTPTSAGTGYFTFSANVDDATVILIDSNDEEHIVGTTSHGSYVVPVEIGTSLYNAYRIEKEGYGAVDGYLYDYPELNGDNIKIAVVLDEQFFTILAAAGPNGQVSPEETIVKPGETLTIRITPNSGYEIEVLQVDGEVVEDPEFEYTFKNIQADHVLVASFN
ncbi:MAG: right-handed parallel beta-helix repeat-containing protein [Methanomicrobiales archaeon]|nr:right-handed parallel beta-helix repeat-containing protein [Methanomicrobiales archaeon]